MRYIIAGVLMAGGVALIVHKAQTFDSYYGSSDVTAWEHASRAGSAPAVLGGSVVASLVALIFLYSGVFRRSLSPLATAVGGALYVVAWLVTWVAMVGGH